MMIRIIKNSLLFVAIMGFAMPLFSQKELSSLIDGQLVFSDATKITLKPGFKVISGGYFRGYIAPNVPNEPVNSTPTAVSILAPIKSVDYTKTYTSGVSSTENYIRTYVPRTAGWSESAANTTPEKVMEDIQYFDGLGRLKQSVSVKASPEFADVITPVVYDAVGREDKKYMPCVYTSANNVANNGAFVANATVIASLETQTKTMFGDENKAYPYAQTIFEPSPLNRVEKQGAPGAAWNPILETGTSVGFEYQTNTEALSSYQYDVTNSSYTAISYPVSSLFVTQTTDEEGNATREYKDIMGKVVMKESAIAETWAQTKYVYDIFEQLACVIPPKAVEGAVVPNPIVEELCYHYRYNSRRLMVAKKLPGASWLYMAYDKRDRLVLTQDGNQRSQSPKYFTCIIYDDLNRPIETNFVSDYYSKISSKNFQQLDDYLYEYENFNPNSSLESEIVSRTHYDDYSKDTYNNTELSTPMLFVAEPGIAEVSQKATSNIGRVTYKKEITQGGIGGVSYVELTTVYYYDKYGRIIQTRSQNHLGGVDVTSVKYDFLGNVIATAYKQSTGSNGNVIALNNQMEYDHRNRLLTTKTSVDGAPAVTTSALKYNKLGQLQTKYLHGADVNKPFLQAVDYIYNIRGWLTSINTPGVLSNDFFAMDLGYEKNSIGNNTYRNGNISNIVYTNSIDKTLHRYDFTYDKLNRLQTADHSLQAGANTNAYDERNISYDMNGNILSLSRYDEVGNPMDELTYNYTDFAKPGNMLHHVKDAAIDKPNFPDYKPNTATTQNYFYDSNGNLTKDNLKGITSIAYNHLNLPSTIQFENSRNLQFAYTPSGVKLRKTAFINNVEQTAERMDYCGMMVYKNNQVQWANLPEGRLVKKDNQWVFEYNLKDHLGNTRVTFAEAAPGIAQILATNNYYPFGLEQPKPNNQPYSKQGNPYRYNGKEITTNFDLDWLDYGARFYDAQIGRFPTQDPQAEDYDDLSPYGYCAGNPIACRDENGEYINYIVGAVVGGVVEAAGQTIAQMAAGRDLSEVDIDWVDVGAATLEGGLTSGGSVLRKVAVTVVSAGVQAAFDDDRNVISGGKSMTQAGKEFAGNMATAGVGAGTQKVVNASTKEAVSSANKQVVRANNAVTTAENRLAKHANSPKAQTNVNNAKSNAQTARNNQVKTQMTHNTVGKTNFSVKGQKVNVAQQSANTGSNVTKNTIVDENKK